MLFGCDISHRDERAEAAGAGAIGIFAIASNTLPPVDGAEGITPKSEVEAASLLGVSHHDSSSEEVKARVIVFFVPYMPTNGIPISDVLMLFSPAADLGPLQPSCPNGLLG